MIRNWILLVGLGLFLGAILWAGTLLYRREGRRQCGEGHAIAYTHSDLSKIGWGLSTLWEQEQRRVDLNKGGRLLSGTELFELLSQSEDAMRYASISTGWPAEELGHWYWGVDVQFGTWQWTGTFYPQTSDVVTAWPF